LRDGFKIREGQNMAENSEIRQKIARYYPHMPMQFREIWDKLSPEEQEAVFPYLDNFHRSMESATWDMVGGIIQALVLDKNT
jgi:hypothetical protein